MFLIFFFIVGLIVGSFLNVVIFRLKQEKKLNGRSLCLNCKQQLKWYHNIPVLAFIFLRGRCAYCRGPISWQYPLVELASGVLFTLGYYIFYPNLEHAVVFALFSSFLITLFVFDLRWYMLPDAITLPAIVVAFAANIYIDKSWLWLMLSAAIGASWFAVQYWVSKGKWVGDGDIRLGALVGAMVASWQGLLIVFFLSYVSGAVVGVILMAAGKKQLSSHLPFGTFLTVATLITLFWGEKIWQWYVGLLMLN